MLGFLLYAVVTTLLLLVIFCCKQRGLAQYFLYIECLFNFVANSALLCDTPYISTLRWGVIFFLLYTKKGFQMIFVALTLAV